MKSFIVLAVLVAVAVALPSPQDSTAQVLLNENDNIGVGDFQAKYATSNGIQSNEAGQLLQGGPDNAAYVAKRGEYSYTGNDGQVYTVQWIADVNGFQPSGAHLPKNP